MIVLRITSGLGNQMYQYAFYTLLKKQYKDTEIACDNRWFHCNFEGREYELESIFADVPGTEFEIKKASFSDVVRLSGKIPNIFDGKAGLLFDKFRRYPNRLLKNNLLKARKPYIIDQFEGDLSDEPDTVCNASGVLSDTVSPYDTPFYRAVMNLDTKNDYYVCGFFVEEKYYSRVLDDMKKRFVFPEFTEEHNIKYADEIRNSNSVSIHVRRGDYLSDLYKEKFITLGRDYYERALNYIKENAFDGKDGENIKFFIFSDDADFIKKEFSWIENKTIITGNTGSISYRDMQLMSLCKHNIIANSTFSQWGALLNSNEGHITIYPGVYMYGRDNENKALPGWVRL